MGTLINDRDRCLFNSIAQEVITLCGTEAVVYQFDEAASTRDPLYDEEMYVEYKKNSTGTQGIRLPIFFKDPDRSGVTGEEGYRLDRTSQVFVAGKDLTDRSMRVLRPGDIIFVWNMYFDVMESHAAEGHMNDSGNNVITYTFDVVRRTKAVPEGLWIRD